MIELLNVDCMEYMAGLPDKAFDLAIVDPPYGNDTDCINVKDGRDNLAVRKTYHGFVNKIPDQKYFDELDRVSKKWIIWGGNFFGIKGGVIAWNKEGTAFGEGEVAICNTHASVRFIRLPWNGMIQFDMKNKEDRIHANQKPISLYKWILETYAKPGFKILDTHLGSGSSALAAHYLGFEFVGCELDEIHFANALKRFNTHSVKQELNF